MKTVLSGVALAAILALGMPAWAQGTDAQQSNAPATGVSTPHAKKAHATRGMHARTISPKRHMRHLATRQRANHHYAEYNRPMYRTPTARMGGSSPTDNVANQLNRAEAQRLMTGSSTPPMGNPNMGPMGNQNMAPMGNPNMAPMGAPNQPSGIQEP